MILKKLMVIAFGACLSLSHADCMALSLSVCIAEDFMVVGAHGGTNPVVFYKTQSEGDGLQYVTLHKESAEDPGWVGGNAFDDIGKQIVEVRSSAITADSNDLAFFVQPEKNREDFLKKLRTYRPLVEKMKKAGYTYITLQFLDELPPNFGDTLNLLQQMYDAVGLKTPTLGDQSKHRTCSYVDEIPKIIRLLKRNLGLETN